MRPDIVWFGEMPYYMDSIEEALVSCDVFVSIGTSGTVYPAAGFVDAASRYGAHCIELNLEASEGASAFHQSIQGPATELVSDFVSQFKQHLKL